MAVLAGHVLPGCILASEGRLAIGLTTGHRLGRPYRWPELLAGYPTAAWLEADGAEVLMALARKSTGRGPLCN